MPCRLFATLLCLLCGQAFAIAIEYHVHPSGADGNPGTNALPFRTVQRAVNAAQAGDVVTVAEGVYRETVTTPRSGANGQPIVIRAATGARVVVSGADVLAGWQPAPGMDAVWTVPMAGTLGDGEQVFVDGVMMNWARWPNSGLDPLRPVETTADNATLNTFPNAGSFADATFNDSECNFPSGFWDGARIVSPLGKGWLVKHGTVTHSEPGSIQFSFHRLATGTTVSATYDPAAGNTFYLCGKLHALDAPGEWFHDAATSRLYLRTPESDAPANHLVEAKRRDLAFDLRGRSDIQLQGIGLFAARILTDSASARLEIDGMEARYVFHTNYVANISFGTHMSDSGIILAGTEHVLRNSEIAYSAGNGVTLLGSGHRIDNCRIHNVDYIGSDASAVNTGLSGEVTNCEISNSTFHDAGRSLLVIRRLASSRIHHNLFHRSMLRTTDGGGIYTYQHDGVNTEIDHNIVRDTTGDDATIYLDNGSSSFRMHHNLLFGVFESGIFLNTPSPNNLVFNNTLVTVQSSMGGGGSADGSELRNNICTGPIGIPSGATLSNNIASTTNPLFTDPSALDFTLSAASPAVDAGMVLPPYTDGFIGAAPDIGAFEFGATPWTAGSSNIPSPSPTNLTATVDITGNILVAWTTPVSGARPLYLERAPTGGRFAPLATLAAGSTSYLDAAPSALTTYTYRIRQGDGLFGAYATGKPDLKIWEKIEAESHNASFGISTSTVLGGCDNNDWARYNAVNFSEPIGSVTFRLAAPTSGNRIEVRLGSTTGTLIAELFTASTGTSFGTYAEQTATFAFAPTGNQDVFIVFKGGFGICNLDWFRFNPVTPLAAPAGAGNSLSAALSGTSSIRVQWTSGGGVENGWQVERSTDGAEFATLSVLPVGATSFDDADLSFGGMRAYRVRAISRQGSSPWSDMAVYALRPMGAGETAVTALTSLTARVTWTVDAPLSSSVSVIERSQSSGGPWTEVGRVPAAALLSGHGTFDDALPVPSVAYYYRVMIEEPNPAGSVIRPAFAQVVALNTANRVPVAIADAFNGAFGDFPTTLAVLSNDTDADGDSLTIAAVTQGAFGTVTFTATQIIYTATAGFPGADAFSYTVRDQFGGTASTTVSLSGPAAITSLIVDNNDAGGVTKTGTWTNSTSAAGYIGANYWHDGNSGKGTKSVKFDLNVAEAGQYRLFGRWSADTARADNVPVAVQHDGGIANVTVNQKLNHYQWVELGTWQLGANLPNSLTISNAATNGFVIVDAYRLVLVPGTNTPLAPANFTASVVSSSVIALTWTDRANNETSFILEISTDGGASWTPLVTLPTNATGFTHSGRPPAASYLYRLRATSDVGSSTPVQAGATTWSLAQQWRFDHFGTTAITADTADDADPNHNGIKNLLEYALGGDPVGSTTGSGILPQIGRSAGNTLQINFSRFLDRTDLTVTVYAADSPAGPWTPIARSTAGSAFVVLEPGTGVIENGTGDIGSVTVSDFRPVDPAHPKRFMRLGAAR